MGTAPSGGGRVAAYVVGPEEMVAVCGPGAAHGVLDGASGGAIGRSLNGAPRGTRGQW